MNSPNHFESRLARFGWILVPLACAAGLCSWRWMQGFPRQTAGSTTGNQYTMPENAGAGDAHWDPFVKKSDKASREDNPLRGRFRLAGIFSAHDARGEHKRAVLDDNKAKAQQIVSEAEVLSDGATVRQIGADFVVLTRDGVEERLTMGGETPGSPTPDGIAMNTAQGNTTRGGAESSGMNAFGGRQVSGNRWVFNRQKLLEYYGQLRDEPERLVKVFDSLKPVYTADRKISGYRLKAEGERAFFDAVGLREGDIIRSVNSLKMTNRRRAETMIRDFVENRSSVFVFEVERGGKTETQIYSVP